MSCIKYDPTKVSPCKAFENRLKSLEDKFKENFKKHQSKTLAKALKWTGTEEELLQGLEKLRDGTRSQEDDCDIRYPR